MNKIILELHDGVDLQKAIKLINELGIATEVKYIQTEDQKNAQVKNTLNPAVLAKSIREWDSNPEFEDFWRTK